MTLNDYLTDRNMLDQDFAKLVKCDRSTIYRLRRGQRPSPDLMKQIVVATGGKVQPNDFYGVPSSDAA
jgi:predicted transcriptional regulator